MLDVFVYNPKLLRLVQQLHRVRRLGLPNDRSLGTLPRWRLLSLCNPENVLGAEEAATYSPQSAGRPRVKPQGV